MTVLKLNELQKEQTAWVQHNFPTRHHWHPLIGVGEEIGELIKAYSERDQDEVKDAVADIVIYMSDFCTAQGINLEDAVCIHAAHIRSTSLPPIYSLTVNLGRIHHAFLKREQGIRGSAVEHTRDMIKWIGVLINDLIDFCEAEDINFTETVERIWAKVRERDWVRFPGKGICGSCGKGMSCHCHDGLSGVASD